MVRKLVHVPLHLFLTGLSTKSLCQIIKSPNISAEAFDDSSNNFLGRSPNFQKCNRRNTYNTRLSDFSSAAFRFCDKFLEMHFETNSGDKVCGYDCELKNNNFFFTFRKSEENKESVSEKVCQMHKIIMLDLTKLLESLNTPSFS